jgi:hypothetical protein
MLEVSFSEYVAMVADAFQNKANHYRNGQAAFNTLYAVHPQLAEQVHNTDIDPFYDDDVLPDFYEWVNDHWE